MGKNLGGFFLVDTVSRKGSSRKEGDALLLLADLGRVSSEPAASGLLGGHRPQLPLSLDLFQDSFVEAPGPWWSRFQFSG